MTPAARIVASSFLRSSAVIRAVRSGFGPTIDAVGMVPPCGTDLGSEACGQSSPSRKDRTTGLGGAETGKGREGKDLQSTEFCKSAENAGRHQRHFISSSQSSAI